jgi:hypothetical protein
VLRKTYWPKRDERTGEWRKLHNEGLNNLVLLTRYFSGDQMRRIRLTGHVASLVERRGEERRGEERRIQGFGGETLRKETTRESQTYMRGKYSNGSSGSATW